MEIGLALLAVIELIVIVLIWRGRSRLQRELSDVNQEYKQTKISMLKKQIQEEKNQEEKKREDSDSFGTYDKVVQMHKAGNSAKIISERLKIPVSKVEMTLKIQKMKKDGTR